MTGWTPDTLEETMRRVRRLSPTLSGALPTVTIPRNLQSVMLERSTLWRWQLTGEGVALVPVAESETEEMASVQTNPATPRLRYTGPVNTVLPLWAIRDLGLE